MERIGPRLRLAGLALPLLTAGCMSGIIPGPDAPDPSCLLLCALTRAIAGEPVPAVPMAEVAPASGPAPIQPAVPHAAPRPRAAVVVAPPRKVVAQLRPRPSRRKKPAQVSVVPQAPAQAPAPVSSSPVPSGPAPAAAIRPSLPPTEPPRTFSQSIPGSAGIMMPSLQGQ